MAVNYVSDEESVLIDLGGSERCVEKFPTTANEWLLSSHAWAAEALTNDDDR